MVIAPGIVRRIEPISQGRSRVTCDRLFAPENRRARRSGRCRGRPRDGGDLVPVEHELTVFHDEVRNALVNTPDERVSA